MQDRDAVRQDAAHPCETLKEMSMNESTLQTNRHGAKRRREAQPLSTLTGQVRSVALTQEGHVACVFDTSAGRLRALSDAASVHLPELHCGRRVQVVLLRLRRETVHGTWDWQLLACQGMDESDWTAKSGEPEAGQKITCAPPPSSTIPLKRRPRSD
jgi:hypothetical protein